MAKLGDVDLDLVQSGRIPWSFEELIAALDFANGLLKTPQDDWERAPRGITLELEPGSLSRFVFNPDMLDNQLGLWLADRLKDQGVDETTRMSHLWRFFLIRSFMATNQAALRDAGIVKNDPEGPGSHLVSDNLFKVLATSEYEGVIGSGPEHDPIRTFHLERVIAETLQLDREEDARG